MIELTIVSLPNTLGVLIFAGTNFGEFLQNLIGQKQRISLQTFKGKQIRENKYPRKLAPLR